MKEYIRDNGKIRDCIQNEAKMNIFEHIYGYWFVWKRLKNHLCDMIYDFKEMLSAFSRFLVDIIGLIFVPVSILTIIPFKSYIAIKKSKEKVKQLEMEKEMAKKAFEKLKQKKV